MKHIWLLALCLMSSVAAMAQQRSDGEMLRIARQRVKANNVTKLKAAKAYNIYGAKGKGFVVVSSKSGAGPVLGYSDRDFDEAHMPDGLRWWLNAIESVECRVESVEPSGASEGPKRSGSNHNSTLSTLHSALSSVEPFVKTRWGQENPYNLQCPKINRTELPPTGCVATAMAQVLKYYEYPARGTGKGSYYLGDAATATTKTISKTYDYANMLNGYTEADLPEGEWHFTSAQNNAVAYLMRDCGYASAMKYTLEGSGATPFDATNGLVDNFQYDPVAIRCELRDFVGEEQWMENIYSTLDARQPIIYLGADETYGGHAFLLDGYDEDGLVHVNWGWDGRADGYFSLADLAVSGILGFNETLRFNQSQYMIYGFRTSPEPEAGQEYTSQWGMYAPDAMEVKDGKSLYSVVFGLFNIHYKPFRGYVGLCFISETNPDNSGIIPIDVGVAGDVKALDGQLEMAEVTLSESDLANVQPGTYRLFIGSLSYDELERDADAVPAIYPGGKSDYTLVKAADGTLTLTDNTITGIKAIDNSTIYNLQLPNDGAVYDLQGRKVGQQMNTDRHGKDGSTVQPFNFSTLKPGMYIRNGKKFVVK